MEPHGITANPRPPGRVWFLCCAGGWEQHAPDQHGSHAYVTPREGECTTVHWGYWGQYNHMVWRHTVCCRTLQLVAEHSGDQCACSAPSAD